MERKAAGKKKWHKFNFGISKNFKPKPDALCEESSCDGIAPEALCGPVLEDMQHIS